MGSRSVSLRRLEALYRERYPAFARAALGLLGDRERAHDAVQEAFARAIRARRRCRGENVEAWVFTILANHCRDELRRLPPPPEPEAANGHPQSWPEVREAVAELPERQRLAVFLRYYAELDYDAIATALGVERGTVAASLHAARANLRTALKEVEG